VPPNPDADPRRFDEHAGSLRSVRSGHLACAWWRVAEYPGGRFALHAGGWCQGVGAFEVPWVGCASKQECLDRLVGAVRSALSPVQERPALAPVQELARIDLLAKVARLRVLPLAPGREA